MKKRIVAFCAAMALTIGLLFSCFSATVSATEGYPLPADKTLYAESALLISLGGEPEQDMVLYAKNPDEVRSPGAMMRYMVMAYALHRIEEKGLDIDTVTGTYTKALFNQYVAGTGVNPAGMSYNDETWTLRDLLTLSFIHSASDAVVVLAEAIDGTVEDFVDGMNKLALELGCVNSHFHQLNGLDSMSQYTTARDTYRIVRYCLQFSIFEELTSVFIHTVHPVSGGSVRKIAGNNELMQSSSQYYYAPIVHSRTGNSAADGRSCAAVARKSGYEYLVVVMGCPQTDDKGNGGVHYRDTTTLFKWAFSDFEYRIVLGKDEILQTITVEHSKEMDRVNLVPAKEIATVVKKDIPNNVIRPEITLYATTVEAPINKGDVYGKVELYVNGDQKIGEVDLVASEAIRHSPLMDSWDKFVSALRAAIPYVLIGVGVLVLLVAAYVVISILHNRRRQRQKYPDFKPKYKE